MTPLEAEIKMDELSKMFEGKPYILTAWAKGIMYDALKEKEE